MKDGISQFVKETMPNLSIKIDKYNRGLLVLNNADSNNTYRSLLKQKIIEKNSKNNKIVNKVDSINNTDKITIMSYFKNYIYLSIEFIKKLFNMYYM